MGYLTNKKNADTFIRLKINMIQDNVNARLVPVAPWSVDRISKQTIAKSSSYFPLHSNPPDPEAQPHANNFSTFSPNHLSTSHLRPLKFFAQINSVSYIFPAAISCV
jgi:hypothetical protein